MTTNEITELSERLDRWADGEPGAMTPDDVSRMLAELIELRKRRHAAVAWVQALRDEL